MRPQVETTVVLPPEAARDIVRMARQRATLMEQLKAAAIDGDCEKLKKISLRVCGISEPEVEGVDAERL